MDEVYPLGITDATPLISRLRASGAQAVFPMSYLNDSLFIIRTLRQQRMTIPAVGGAAGYIIPDFYKASASSQRTCSRSRPQTTKPWPLRRPVPQALRRVPPANEAITHAVALEVLVQAVERGAGRSRKR